MAGALATGAPTSAISASGNGVFNHGIASGDPMPGSVLLWTRVTPTPESLPGTAAGT